MGSEMCIRDRNTGVSELKDEMEYILVYNESVNSDEEEILKKKQNGIRQQDTET